MVRFCSENVAPKLIVLNAYFLVCPSTPSLPTFHSIPTTPYQQVLGHEWDPSESAIFARLEPRAQRSVALAALKKHEGRLDAAVEVFIVEMEAEEEAEAGK
jgi:hypothetical protein